MIEIFDVAKNISRRHEALSSEIRVLILAIIASDDGTKWSEIRDTLENIMGRRINPNILAFHLRRLLDSGLVKKEGDMYTVNLPHDLKRELKALIQRIEELD